MASSLPFLLFLFSGIFLNILDPSHQVLNNDLEKGHGLDPSLIRKEYQEMQYSTLHPVAMRASQLEREIKEGANKSYGTILRMDAADMRAGGQKPITFVLEFLGAAVLPQSFMEHFPSDVVSRANRFKTELPQGDLGGGGNYLGMTVVRQGVADFIARRDGNGTKPDFNNIFLANGVSDGFEMVMQLLQGECKSGEDVGILLPIPLYSMYSGFMTQYGIKLVPFYLRQDNNWEYEIPEMEKALLDFKSNCANCRPRALLFTNPGMPWGRIQTREKIQEIIKLAHENQLVVIADEICQDSVLGDIPFISARKVMLEMPFPYNETEMINLYSISKGYIGEKGLRGGYMELVNINPKINGIIGKLKAVKLHPNQAGQAALFAYVNPPTIGEPSFDQFNKEKNYILETQRSSGKKLFKELNMIDGVTCTEMEGGLVAFANITLPPKAILEAECEGVHPDILYSLQLLEETGITVAPGSSFSMPQEEHFIRIVFPALESNLRRFLTDFRAFHEKFLQKYV